MKESSQFSARLQHLIGNLMRLAMQNHYRFIKQQGLTMPQMMILYHVQRMGSCKVSGIAEEFGISDAAASQLVDRLVQQGYLIRQEYPQDRRSKETSLTEAGQQIIQASLDAHQNWVSELATTVNSKTQKRLLPLLDELILITQRWFEATSHSSE